MKNTLKRGLVFSLAFSGITAFAQESLNITVKNSLDFDRHEVIAIKTSDISGFLSGKNEKDIRMKNTNGELEVLQWIDYDGDGHSDELLFMPEIAAYKSADFTLVAMSDVAAPVSKYKTFSRFVPERTDDYTWENDKVAFRTYGPDAQMRAEKKLENGTLGSGIDIWLKRTPESVINKWYAGYKTDPMFYHKDKGEGYDPYHVGASRGTGGTGIWAEEQLMVSKNFVKYKTIATGPLRTVFELNYAPYSPYQVRETKRISLDLGSNFSRFEISYTSSKALPNYAVGITLHDNAGTTELNAEQGIFLHHEKIDDVYVGEALVISPEIIEKGFANKSKEKDQSNLIVLTKPTGKTTYYAGFAWQKSGQVTGAPDWNKLAQRQAQALASPLKVIIK